MAGMTEKERRQKWTWTGGSALYQVGGKDGFCMMTGRQRPRPSQPRHDAMRRDGQGMGGHGALHRCTAQGITGWRRFRLCAERPRRTHRSV